MSTIHYEPLINHEHVTSKPLMLNQHKLVTDRYSNKSILPNMSQCIIPNNTHGCLVSLCHHFPPPAVPVASPSGTTPKRSNTWHFARLSGTRISLTYGPLVVAGYPVRCSPGNGKNQPMPPSIQLVKPMVCFLVFYAHPRWYHHDNHHEHQTS